MHQQPKREIRPATWVEGAYPTIALICALILTAPTWGEANAEPVFLYPNHSLIRQIDSPHELVVAGRARGGTTQIVKVHQRDVDVAFRINLEDGTVLGPFDSPLREQGFELVLLAPANDTDFQLSVFVTGSRSTSGEVSLEMVPMTTQGEDLERISAYRLMENAASMSFETDKKRQDAIATYEAALAIWEGLEADLEIATVNLGIANLYAASEQRERAAQHYERAYSSYLAIDDQRQAAWCSFYRFGQIGHLGREQEALATLSDTLESTDSKEFPFVFGVLLDQLSFKHYTTGEFDRALPLKTRAAKLLEPAPGLEHYKASVLHNAAMLNHALGKTDVALEQMARVLSVDQSLGNPTTIASTLENMGFMYRVIGQCSRAIPFFARATEQLQDKENNEDRSRILGHIGSCYLDLGNANQARQFYDQALNLNTQDLPFRARILDYLGDLHFEQGELDQARARHEQSLALWKQIGNKAVIATKYIDLAKDALAANQIDQGLENLSLAEQRMAFIQSPHAIGDLHLTYGIALMESRDFENAKNRLTEAFTYFQESEYKQRIIKTLIAQSKLSFLQNDIVDAVEKLDRAIVMVETSRSEIGEDLRPTFFASARKLFELKIKYLMELYAKSDDAKLLRQAWQTADQMASRGLFDELDDQHGLQDIAPELAQKRTRLQNDLTQQLAALNRAQNDAIRDTLKTNVRDLRLELNTLNSEIIDRHPELKGTAWQPPDIREIQSSLAPTQALIQYSVGQERSFSWLVTRDHMSATELPSRSELGESSNTFLHHVDERQLLSSNVLPRLSDTLINNLDIPAHIDSLIVIPDGAISYLPIQAFRLRDGTMVIERFDVIKTPSVNLFLRELDPLPELREIVVVYDPVYSSSDQRLATLAQPLTAVNLNPELTRSATSMGTELNRLAFTQQEAKSIFETATDVEVKTLGGFDATKEAVKNDALRYADIIHIAAHGLANPIHPELSGLVLSLLNADGEAQDGFLGLSDINTLKTNASLVVLSACQTALGPEIHGEGMISLARGFMSNGTQRVIASSWQVPDKATARLMRGFYEQLLSQGASTSAALRAAQLQIRAKQKWREPYYWAGFSLWSSAENHSVQVKSAQ